MPEGHNADNFRKVTLEPFDVSLGTGLTKLAGKVFRIGHLGDTNDLTILGTLAGVEMGLRSPAFRTSRPACARPWTTSRSGRRAAEGWAVPPLEDQEMI